MEQTDLHDPFQSAYKSGQSIKKALMRVRSDLATALDKRGVAVLVLLDLSAAGP